MPGRSTRWSTDTGAGLAGYQIRRDGVLVATVDELAVSWQDDGVAPSTAYAYTVRAFDAGAFEALMRLHNRRLYRTARALLRNDAEAEDALQESYLAAFRALHGFRGEASLATWLRMLARA